MLTTVFWVIVGIVVGWFIPQPDWAKTLFQKVADLFKKKDDAAPKA